MKNKVQEITNCRLCGSSSLKTLLKFPDVPLGNNYQENKNIALGADEFPLQVNNCGSCNHFQLSHSINPVLLYATNYTYLSGVNLSFRAHFMEYVKWIEQKSNITRGDLVLDIGSNDGSCLAEFQKRGFVVCGVDPAAIPAKLANQKGIFTYNRFFDFDTSDEILKEFGQPKLITSHNVLAHVDNLLQTFKIVYEMLSQDGFFCFEVGYFRDVLEKGLFDTIYHEHLDYHHAAPLILCLEKVGFSIERIERIEVQGGSIRMLCKKATIKKKNEHLKNFLIEEEKSLLSSRTEIESWMYLVQNKMIGFGSQIKKYKSEGKKIVGYGAPTKTTLFLTMAGLSSNHIDFIVEDNALKCGRYLPKLEIPICEIPLLTSVKPDIIIVFAWNFFDDILEKIKSLELQKPTVVIRPLPVLESVKIN